jgi:hypothetical protein
MDTIIWIIATLLVTGGVVIYFVKAGKIKDSDGDLIPDVVEDKVAQAKKTVKAVKAKVEDVKEIIEDVKEVKKAVKKRRSRRKSKAKK